MDIQAILRAFFGPSLNAIELPPWLGSFKLWSPTLLPPSSNIQLLVIGHRYSFCIDNVDETNHMPAQRIIVESLVLPAAAATKLEPLLLRRQNQKSKVARGCGFWLRWRLAATLKVRCFMLLIPD